MPGGPKPPGGAPPSLMPPVFPGLLFDRLRPPMGGVERERSASPNNDMKKVSETMENNNLQPKGMYGELDLSMRPTSQPIKT